MALELIADSLAVRVDSLATSLQSHVDSLGADADLRTIFPSVQPRLQDARNLYLEAIREAERVLTRQQWQQLPEWLRNPAFGRQIRRQAPPE